MLASIGRGFVGADRGGDIVAVDIDRMEGLDDSAPGDPARDNIGGVDGIGILGGWVRTIALALALRRGTGVAVENPLNGAQAGRRPIAFALFALDRPRADPRKTSIRRPVLDQVLPQPQDTPLDHEGGLIGMLVRSTRARAKAGPEMLSAIGKPFVDPAHTALELPSDHRDGDSALIEANSSSPLLGRQLFRPWCFIHNSPPDRDEYGAFHDVLNTANSRLHDVLNTRVFHDVLNTDN